MPESLIVIATSKKRTSSVNNELVMCVWVGVGIAPTKRNSEAVEIYSQLKVNRRLMIREHCDEVCINPTPLLQVECNTKSIFKWSLNLEFTFS